MSCTYFQRSRMAITNIILQGIQPSSVKRDIPKCFSCRRLRIKPLTFLPWTLQRFVLALAASPLMVVAHMVNKTHPEFLYTKLKYDYVHLFVCQALRCHINWLSEPHDEYCPVLLFCENQIHNKTYPKKLRISLALPTAIPKVIAYWCGPLSKCFAAPLLRCLKNYYKIEFKSHFTSDSLEVILLDLCHTSKE